MLALYRSTGHDATAFKHAAEQWFDDSMERVSGWYRRKVQLLLFVIATLVVRLSERGHADDGACALAGRCHSCSDRGVKAELRPRQPSRCQARRCGERVSTSLSAGISSVGDAPTQLPNDWLALLAKLAGLALTIGAVMLGAPFWFDLLSKVVDRSTGAPPPASDATRSGEGEQPQTGLGAKG